MLEPGMELAWLVGLAVGWFAHMWLFRRDNNDSLNRAIKNLEDR